MNAALDPEVLFHFANVSDSMRRGWMEDLLLRSRAYFRQRDQLNDPSELRPSFILEGMRGELLKYVRRIRRFDKRPLTPARRLLEEQRLMNVLMSRPTMPEEQLHDLLDGIGIFCLSESCSSQLMWAHYADGGRGIAIEFDPHVGFFSVAQRVTYSDQPPVIRRLQDTLDEIFSKAMLWKHSNWSYEQEWRVIARFADEARQEKAIAAKFVGNPSVAEFMRAQNGPGHYAFPENAVRSVALGVRTPDEDEEWLRKVLARRATQVPVRMVRMERGLLVLD